MHVPRAGYVRWAGSDASYDILVVGATISDALCPHATSNASWCAHAFSSRNFTVAHLFLLHAICPRTFYTVLLCPIRLHIYIYIYTVYRTYPRLSFFELYLTRLLKYRYTVPFKTSRDELLKIRQRERGARRRNKHFASVRREKLYSVEYRNLPSYSTFVAIYLS